MHLALEINFSRMWKLLLFVLVGLLVLMKFPSNGEQTVDSRMREIEGRVKIPWEKRFEECHAIFPPQKIWMVVIKKDARLEIHAPDQSGKPVFIKSWPILAKSGKLGPKLKEGDFQIPEGIYRIESLNPNSRYHLALRVNYPNERDRAEAKKEGRSNLGGDIMIHGNAVSIGCVAIGDDAIEEVFYLAARTGIQNITVLMSPIDFRKESLPEDFVMAPSWMAEVYEELRVELSRLPVSENESTAGSR